MLDFGIMRTQIGINADSGKMNGDLSILDRMLADSIAAGFDAVEIPAHGTDCIMHGRLRPERVEATARILSRHELVYTVHAPDPVNLADPDDPRTHDAALRASVDLARDIGARIVVFHGSRSPGWVRGSDPDRASMEEEIGRLSRIAEYAGERGVTLAVENIFRQAPGEGGYRIDPRSLAKVVDAVASPHLGICLDFGHAFLSAGEEGFGMGEALGAVLPRLVHVHVHDNFGIPARERRRTLDALCLGEGDLHLPPGWGSIPYEALYPALRESYRGVHMLEIDPRFRDRYADARTRVERLAGRVRD